MEDAIMSLIVAQFPRRDELTLGARFAIVSLPQFAAMFPGRKNWRARQRGCPSFLSCVRATNETTNSPLSSSPPISLSLFLSLSLSFSLASSLIRAASLPPVRRSAPLAHPHRAERLPWSHSLRGREQEQ